VESALEILFVIAVIAASIVAIVVGYIAEKRRREAMMQLSAELGLQFNPSRDSSRCRNRFDHIDLLRSGNNRYTQNHLTGLFRDRPVTICDFHYETYSHDNKGRRRTHHHWYGVAFIEIPLVMREIRIRREGWFDKVVAAVGFDDIDFESVEFSRRFHVKAADRKFAYDLIHARAMEFFLANDRYSWEMEGGVIAVYQKGRFAIPQIRPVMDTALQFIDLIPEYVWVDHGTRRKAALDAG